MASRYRAIRKRIGLRRKGIYWDYNGDGVFHSERIKGFYKKYWRRWKRRREKTMEQI